MKLRRFVAGTIFSVAMMLGVASPASAVLDNVSVNVECVNAVNAIDSSQNCNTGDGGH